MYQHQSLRENKGQYKGRQKTFYATILTTFQKPFPPHCTMFNNYNNEFSSLDTQLVINNEAILLEALLKYAAEQEYQKKEKSCYYPLHYAGEERPNELKSLGDILGVLAAQCQNKTNQVNYSHNDKLGNIKLKLGSSFGSSKSGYCQSAPRWASPDWHVASKAKAGLTGKSGTGVFIPKASTQYTDHQKELVYRTIESILEDEEY
eukprot:TRINITY_DN8443_c0_g3_i1.p3 TRINITY_DN8443_c0_g3~~TRINITY_DN8443_c0_g3_i1.p3  ORF type:complete len:205 (+),score=13.41 TRINITY_DN8443_c0_g3_i1:108-722(+)